MKWNADLYQNSHDFVSAYGRELLDYVPDDPRMKILDLGCGTGDLTAELSRKSPHIMGVDSSPDMIEKARALHPGLDFLPMDAGSLEWQNTFDLVFSNAVLHWIMDQRAVLRAVYRALTPGGVFLCEFGAQGNIAQIEKAFQTALAKRGASCVSLFNFPSMEEYRLLLEQTGFQTETLFAFDRPTPLKGGKNGLRTWMQQFYASSLHAFTEEEQSTIFAETEQELIPHLWNGSQWVADYRRLRHLSLKRA